MNWRDRMLKDIDAEPDTRPLVPECVDTCSKHDGKRCELIGLRAPEGHACVPATDWMAQQLDGKEKLRGA